ncbi:hypothetical protein IBTHAUMO2_1030023 [Nitrosopumilaceae archaeon]|nr:hypothetical protein IBTHAUMO2_1030023 [Nitrosopumilaceae archaeon]
MENPGLDPTNDACGPVTRLAVMQSRSPRGSTARAGWGGGTQRAYGLPVHMESAGPGPGPEAPGCARVDVNPCRLGHRPVSGRLGPPFARPSRGRNLPRPAPGLARLCPGTGVIAPTRCLNLGT